MIPADTEMGFMVWICPVRTCAVNGGKVQPQKLSKAKEQPQFQQTEEELQQAITQALTLKGFEVARLSRVRPSMARIAVALREVIPHEMVDRAVNAISKVLSVGDGVERGKVGDLLVRRHDWPRGLAANLEVKTPQGKWSSPEQACAHAAGWTHLVRSIDDALERATDSERVIPNPSRGTQ